MNLERRHYVRNWPHMAKDELTTVTVTRDGKPLEGLKPERISYVAEHIAYWRKANAIHRWFVTNCQDGEDDCREAWVSDGQIRELVELCKRLVSELKLVKGKVSTGYRYEDGKRIETFYEGLVVANPELAAELLPAQEGFFFGATSYDEWYVNDLKQTIEMLEPELEVQAGDFYYSSSW